MTDTTPGTILDAVCRGLRDAGTAAARSLPLREVIAVDDPRQLTSDLLPGPGAQALAVTVTGALDGTVVLVVDADLAAAIQSGPLGADDLTAALGAPLNDAVSLLEDHLGAPIHAGVSEVVEADAIEFDPDAVGVSIRDGDSIVAALVVELSAQAAPAAAAARSMESADFTPLVDDGAAPAESARSLELLHDVEMAVTVELGRTRMAVRDLLSLVPGAVVELDRAAGSPVDVLVNGKLIAKGEVVVIDDDFGIRISEIIGLRPTR